MRAVIFLVVATCIAHAMASSSATVSVQVGPYTYATLPFIGDIPGDVYKYAHSQSNSENFLTEAIDREGVATLAFIRTPAGMYLNLILDSPEGSGGSARFNASCLFDGAPNTAACLDIFRNVEICDDGSECDATANADGSITSDTWNWGTGYTDGMVSGKFPDGCTQLTIQFIDLGASNKIEHVAVVSRSPVAGQARTPVYLTPTPPASSKITINFCVTAAPVTCDTSTPTYSRGDPHFRTGDGRRYDYMGLGQHHFCNALDGSVLIQSCQQPRWSGSRAATNRAVAVRLGAQTIFFGVANDNNFKILVANSATGELLDLTTIGTGASRTLANGRIFGNFVGAGSSVTVLHTAGWRLELLSRSGTVPFVDIVGFTGPEVEFPGAEGLCGKWNCIPQDDFTSPDGELLTSANDFGFSWRVNNTEDSFFDSFPDVSARVCASPPEPQDDPPTPTNCAQNPSDACNCCRSRCGVTGANPIPGLCSAEDFADCVLDVEEGVNAGEEASVACEQTTTDTCNPGCTSPEVCIDGTCGCPNGGSPPTCEPVCDSDTPAISQGDPHFVTFDGLRYNYQGRGLFTFCSTSDNAVVEVCHVNRSESSRASVNGAVAFKVGSNIFSIAFTGGQHVSYVDWVVRSFTAGSETTLSGGAHVIRSSDGRTYDVRYNGHRLVARTRGRVLDLKFYPAASTNTEGLCGSRDCDRTNDFTLSGTNSIVSSANEFGDSWELQNSGLFTGAPYTCNPPPNPPNDDPPLVCSQSSTDPICVCCRDKGFTSGIDLENCVFDMQAAVDAGEEIEEVCAEVPPECDPGCNGECNTAGVCECPQGGTPPECLGTGDGCPASCSTQHTCSTTGDCSASTSSSTGSVKLCFQ